MTSLWKQCFRRKGGLGQAHGQEQEQVGRVLSAPQCPDLKLRPDNFDSKTVDLGTPESEALNLCTIQGDILCPYPRHCVCVCGGGLSAKPVTVTFSLSLEMVPQSRLALAIGSGMLALRTAPQVSSSLPVGQVRCPQQPGVTPSHTAGAWGLDSIHTGGPPTSHPGRCLPVPFLHVKGSW